MGQRRACQPHRHRGTLLSASVLGVSFAALLCCLLLKPKLSVFALCQRVAVRHSARSRALF